ncbi:MAG: LysR substrate-binding domain-containing protein [Chitinophagales bacterium]
MEYIVALDTYRHYVTASEKCFVTQPTLSMQVHKLEEEIGTLLFDRTQKPLKPTQIGVQFIEKAREILREVKQLEAIVSEERHSIEGVFHIGIIPTLAPYLLPLFLPSFVKQNPKTKLVIEELESLEMIRRIKEETIDLGIIVTPLQEKSIREIPMFNEPFLVYLPENHTLLEKKTIKPDDLKVENALVLEEGHCFRNQSLKICKQTASIETTGYEYLSGSIETLKRMVDKGLGYTLVPELSVLNQENKQNIKRFEEKQPVREVSLACHKSFAKERLIEKIRDVILKNIPEKFTINEDYIRVRWRS